MMHYRDRVYCGAGDACVCSDDRKLTPEVEAAARAWWDRDDAPVPIATSDLCAEKRAQEVQP